MRRLLFGVVLVLTAACTRMSAGPGASASSPTPPPSYPASWRFHTEEEWLVAQTVEAIAGIAAFVSKPEALPPFVTSVEREPLGDPLAPRRFEIALVPGVFPVARIDLHVEDHLWSPATFATVARELLPAAPSAVGPPPSDLPGALLDLRVETLERANERVSAALGRAPLDPGLHEQAALLVAAFALREDGWHFADTRVALCRLAAHLAIARAAGATRVTNVGRLAEAALDVLALRQRAAVAALDALQLAGRGEAAWAASLRMAATGDWRALEKPERASLLERLVYMRTLAQRIGADRAQAFVDRAGVEPVTDWRRSMLGGPHAVTVEACNRYSMRGVEEDEAEMLGVWKLERGAELDPDVWLAAIQKDPAPSPVVREGAARVRVLDLGMWTAFERRQVLGQLMWDARCFAAYGLEEAGSAYAAAASRRYAALDAYALVEWETASDAATYRRAADRAVAILMSRPDLATATQWVRLSAPHTFGAPRDIPSYALWFDPYSPFGTAYDARDRACEVAFRSSRNDDYKVVGSAQAEIAPYQYDLRFRLVQWRSGKHNMMNLEIQEPIYAGIADYDAWALDALAQEAAKRGKDEKYRLYAGRLCDLDVERCRKLAKWLAAHKEDDQAAAVFRRWAKTARDRVEVSNEIEWLVDYEYEHGRKAEAYRLAREAAATYSSRGLAALGALCERDGDIPGAEAAFARDWERYEDSMHLLDFYRRHQGIPKLEGRLQRLETSVFPGGLQKVDSAATGSEAPRDGVFFNGSSAALVAARLAPGQVVVGLDGYRVRNVKQYLWIRSLGSEDAPLTLDVWTGNGYARLAAHPEKRIFGVDMETYRPRSS